MKRVVLALAAIALTATGASADTGSCLSLTDPAGDAAFVDGAPVPGTLDGADLVAFRASATTDAVSVVFSLAGRPEAAPGEIAKYTVQFGDATHLYRLEGDVWYGDVHTSTDLPFSLDVGTRQVSNAGGEVIAWDKLPVAGSVDLAAHTVTVTASAADFGSLVAGQEWTVDEVATSVGATSIVAMVVDRTVAPHTLVVGAGC